MTRSVAPASIWNDADIITTAELARRTQTSPSAWEQRRIKGAATHRPVFCGLAALCVIAGATSSNGWKLSLRPRLRRCTQMADKRNPGALAGATGANKNCLTRPLEPTPTSPLWQRRTTINGAMAMREACLAAGNSGAVHWRDEDWRFLARVGANHAPSPAERVRLIGLYRSLEATREVRHAA